MITADLMRNEKEKLKMNYEVLNLISGVAQNISIQILRSWVKIVNFFLLELLKFFQFNLAST